MRAMKASVSRSTASRLLPGERRACHSTIFANRVSNGTGLRLTLPDPVLREPPAPAPLVAGGLR